MATDLLFAALPAKLTTYLSGELQQLMTFLNPFVLFGLAAAAIPIILHLIHLRKLRTIEFSTLKFLKELQRTRIRRLKLRQLLLLILRTLLVIFLVFAFARPTIRGTFIGGLGPQARTTAVLILDDSYSMSASDAEGEYVNQAKDAAFSVADLLKEGDEVYVVPLSHVGAENDPDPEPHRDLAVVRSLVRQMPVTSVHRHLQDALRLAARLLSRSRNYNKEVYVVSDFQEGVIAGDKPGTTPPQVPFGADTRLYFVHVGNRDLDNIGIKSVEIPNSLIEVKRPFSLAVETGNYSTAAVSNYLVSVFLNGTRVAQRGLDIDAGQVVRSEFSLVPRSSGFVDGFVELEDDDLLYDNRAYFSLHLPEQIRILLIGSTSDVRYLSLALGTRTGESAPLSVSSVPYDRIPDGSWDDYDVIILANPGQQSTPFAERLVGFVSNGGGLLIFPGPNTQPETFNRTYAAAGLPSLQGIETIPPDPGSASFIQIQRTELRHPLFEGMFEDEQTIKSDQSRGSVESPQIQTFARFLPSASAISVITLSNGVPFLLEQKKGPGRVLAACVPATLQWSDFPLKGLFVPLLHRSVSYLTQEQIRQQSVFAGDPVPLRLADVHVKEVVVQTPQGIEAAVAPVPSGSRGARTFTETTEPGIYTVRENATAVNKFTVNVDPDESRTRPADQGALHAMTTRLGIPEKAVLTIDRPSGGERVILESRFGVELWKYFLIAALVAAVAEMIVARDSRKNMEALDQ